MRATPKFTHKNFVSSMQPSQQTTGQASGGSPPCLSRQKMCWVTEGSHKQVHMLGQKKDIHHIAILQQTKNWVPLLGSGNVRGLDNSIPNWEYPSFAHTPARMFIKASSRTDTTGRQFPQQQTQQEDNFLNNRHNRKTISSTIDTTGRQFPQQQTQQEDNFLNNRHNRKTISSRTDTTGIFSSRTDTTGRQ